MPETNQTPKSISIEMNKSIGWNYPEGTGRFSIVNKKAPNKYTIAFAGDSTIDNGAHIEYKKPYVDKQYTVVRQVASALAQSPGNEDICYILKNFSVDGATTKSMRAMPMDMVFLNPDEDHPNEYVCQVSSINDSRPDAVVLSVGGNNYRLALQGALPQLMSHKQLIFRQTPASAKNEINDIFAGVQKDLLNEYKKIVDDLIDNNSNLKRLILVSQYYPALTMFTEYFIYAGFTHVANSSPEKGKDAFTAIQQTIEGLYSEIIKYVAHHPKINERNIEIVFLDVPSSLNPADDLLTLQIEPNEMGAKVIAELVAHGIIHDFTQCGDDPSANKVKMVLSKDKQHVDVTPLSDDDVGGLTVKSIKDHIEESRWRSPLPSPNTPWLNRLENSFLFFHGNYFDQSYLGLFKFGLIDIATVTSMAGYCWYQSKSKSPNVQACIIAVAMAALSVLSPYLWRHAINQDANRVTSRLAGGIAAPVLFFKGLIATICTLLVLLPLSFSHRLMQHCCQQKELDVIKIGEEENTNGNVRINIESDEASTPLLSGVEETSYNSLSGS